MRVCGSGTWRPPMVWVEWWKMAPGAPSLRTLTLPILVPGAASTVAREARVTLGSRRH
jgi:hypothetical protein